MGCQKDNIESYVGQENFLKPLNSTSNENLFFDINNASRLLYENGVNTRTGNVPDILTACRDKLYEQNNMYDFVDSVVERIGYPVWLNSLIEQSLDSSLQVIYIPFVKQNSNHIEALLRAVSPSQIDTSTLNFDIVTDYELVQMDRGEFSYNENTCQDVLRFAAFNYQMFNDTSRFQTLLQKSCFSQSPPESPYSYHQLNNRSEWEELEITYCFFLNEDSPYTSSNWGGGSPGGWSYVYGGTNGFSNPGFTIVYGGNFGTYSGEGGYGVGATLVNCNDAATTGFLDFLAGIFCAIGDFFEQIFSCGGAKCPPEPFNNPTSIVDLRYNEPEYICQTYLVTVCNDGEWWEIVESIPCPDCDGNLTPDEYLAHQCQNDMLSFGEQHCGLLKLVKQNNIDLSGFCSETGFDTQAALMAVMGLTTEQQTWLASNPTLFNDVVAFLDDKCWDEGSVDYVMYMINEMAQGAAYKFERVIELYNMIESNPDLLYDCFQEPYQVSFWSDLASFIPGSSVIEKLQNTPGNWNVQEISSAAGTKVNLDYFSVIIQDLPYLNGQQLSGDQLLQHIRLNLNDFVDNSIAAFYPYNSNEEALWQSANPLSAIITISMTDDGSVVCSEYQSCCWIFTTLDAPEDGAHPVSGNRQFGWRVNPTGQIEFYVKGADRMTKWYHNIGAPYGFTQADNLWNSYLSKLVSFVNENGGSGMSNLPITYRLNWQKVKEDLMKDTPISIISCE